MDTKIPNRLTTIYIWKVGFLQGKILQSCLFFSKSKKNVLFSAVTVTVTVPYVSTISSLLKKVTSYSNTVTCSALLQCPENKCTTEVSKMSQKLLWTFQVYSFTGTHSINWIKCRRKNTNSELTGCFFPHPRTTALFLKKELE